MAEDLDDGEFWLPSEFLAEGILMEKKNCGGDENKMRVCFPYEFPYEFDSYGSNLSSPVESVVGSTENESDEDDYMAGLTLKMAHSMLQDEDKNKSHSTLRNQNHKTRVLAGSPQSTLCTSLGSSRGSSNGPSLVSSPPTTPLEEKNDAWELLYAAAGQVVKMEMKDQGPRFHGRGLLGYPGKPTSPAIVKPPSFKQQQMVKNQQQGSGVWGRQGKVRGGGFGNGRCGRPLGVASSAWPPLQNQNQVGSGSGMRALFLGGSGSRKESAGTGFFLPRRVGNPTDVRKKPACSTVLLPARVVQALNLNLDEMGNAQPRFHGSFIHDHEAMLAPTIALQSPQKRNNLRPHQPPPPSNQEIRLPPEWTY
ncbi:uncharacterized protein LOC143851155 isoform X2 [Tasmannia lanceolata]|uniref:uncharacterized protein LOC143851155 isoform X2 n=1 Tax=Tasmannia lanceolata TaxID=3420 RepID=UPI004062E90F